MHKTHYKLLVCLMIFLCLIVIPTSFAADADSASIDDSLIYDDSLNSVDDEISLESADVEDDTLDSSALNNDILSADYYFNSLHTSDGLIIKNDSVIHLANGVYNVNLKQLIEVHKSHGKLATITAVNLAGRFGVLGIDEDEETINQFAEKSKEDGGWINGGFMVMEPEVLDYINGDETIFERDPLENLAKDGELKAYKHHGFWKCMDTKRDHDALEEMWDNDDALWYIWK